MAGHPGFESGKSDSNLVLNLFSTEGFAVPHQNSDFFGDLIIGERATPGPAGGRGFCRAAEFGDLSIKLGNFFEQRGTFRFQFRDGFGAKRFHLGLQLFHAI